MVEGRLLPENEYFPFELCSDPNCRCVLGEEAHTGDCRASSISEETLKDALKGGVSTWILQALWHASTQDPTMVGRIAGEILHEVYAQRFRLWPPSTHVENKESEVRCLEDIAIKGTTFRPQSACIEDKPAYGIAEARIHREYSPCEGE